MISFIVGLAMSSGFIFSEANSGNNPSNQFKFERPTAPIVKVYSSNWETVTIWNRVENKKGQSVLYVHQRSLSQLNNELIDNGLVLVFAKGYTLQLGVQEEKPLGLPFTFFSADAASTEPYNWHQQSTPGAVHVQLAVPKSSENIFLQCQPHLRFRYFLLSPQFFIENNITQAQVKSLSYKKLVALLGTTE